MVSDNKLLKIEYKTYSNLLEGVYPELPFDNHCYLRIALDNEFGDVWSKRIESPAINHLSEQQLKSVINRLKMYATNKDLLIRHNKNSILYRQNTKCNEREF